MAELKEDKHINCAVPNCNSRASGFFLNKQQQPIYLCKDCYKNYERNRMTNKTLPYRLIDDTPPMFIPRDNLQGIDIEKEYKLIQRKESDLSANKRRLVVARYERDHETTN